MKHTSVPTIPYVLLIEDDKAEAELAFLAWQEKQIKTPLYWVNSFKEVHTLLNCLKDQESIKPLVILLDLNLRPMHGFDILPRLRTNPATKHIPVVIVSSSLDEKDIEKSYRLGANGFVQKSYNFEEFAKSMNAINGYWCKVNMTVT